ncbi:MAG: chlorophyll synthase ChlG [Gammaproteobacteria bacterium]|nr:chlorophyll synthase ChlG [Gammaproteobacteria bacterium]
MSQLPPSVSVSAPSPGAVLQLLKPVTWFPPMWALACGVVSAGASMQGRWHLLIFGIALAGPLVCGTSQAVNDWFDRHVDAINEPDRPIPSGRVPGRWGLWIAIVWTVLSLAVATVLGPWGFAAAVVAMILAWLYSAPPVRLKQNGWWGNSAVAACYEGLPWFTGAVIMTGALPDARIIVIAVLYSVGAHGIMTVNDFKAIEGDRRMGVDSLPVQLGSDMAALLACWIMALPQIVVVALLLHWGATGYALAVALLVIAQLIVMRRWVDRPRELGPWYNLTGINFYVIGMMVSAVALAGLQ